MNLEDKVFISIGAKAAIIAAYSRWLLKRGYHVFMDFENPAAEAATPLSSRAIESASDVIVILTSKLSCRARDQQDCEA